MKKNNFLLEFFKESGAGILALILVFGSLIFISKVTDFLSKDTRIVQTPSVESPITTSTVDGLGDCKNCGGANHKIIEIVTSTDYSILDRNVWTSSTIFLNQMESIALNGEFIEAWLIVKGTFQDEEDHLLSLTIDYASGKYNVEKSGCKKETGCLFEKGEEIDIAIDLMGKQLLSGKNYILWDNIQPEPDNGVTSIAKILALPMDLQGNPSGTISSLEVHYLCKDKDGCEIKRCKDYPELSVKDAEYQCAVDEFGKDSAKHL